LMPTTLRMAFIILSFVTAMICLASFQLTFFIWAWGGGWFGLVPLAPSIVYATVTILVMNRRAWARFATPLFPVTLAGAAVWVVPGGEFPILLAAAALTTVAVALIFVPASRIYFSPRRITSRTDPSTVTPRGD